jgi:hypothetical protein
MHVPQMAQNAGVLLSTIEQFRLFGGDDFALAIDFQGQTPCVRLITHTQENADAFSQELHLLFFSRNAVTQIDNGAPQSLELHATGDSLIRAHGTWLRSIAPKQLAPLITPVVQNV